MEDCDSEEMGEELERDNHEIESTVATREEAESR